MEGEEDTRLPAAEHGQAAGKIALASVRIVTLNIGSVVYRTG